MKNLKDYIHLYIGCEVACYSDKLRASKELERYATLDGVVYESWRKSPPIKVSCIPEGFKNRYHYSYDVDEIKLLLRPLSDMTEEEKVEFIHLKFRSIMGNIDRTFVTKIHPTESPNIISFSFYKSVGCGAEAGSRTYYINQSDPEQFQYLLSRGFDLFGLIEAGLAIDKTKMS